MTGFRLTRQAAIMLRDIHAQSLEQWGQKTADKYLAELYTASGKAVARPEIGQLRMHRAKPFLMIPAGRHFIVYDRLESDIVVLAILHQRRDIERVIAEMEPAFMEEIISLRNGLR